MGGREGGRDRQLTGENRMRNTQTLPVTANKQLVRE